MMTYLFLGVLIAIFTIFIFRIFKDLLSPSFIYCCSMFCCTICAFLGLFFWNSVEKLSITTMLIIVLSILSFFVGELIVRKVFFKNKINEPKKLDLNRVYNVKSWKLLLQILFMIITLILMFLEIRRIAVSAGFVDGGIGKMIGTYRDVSTLFSTELIENGQNINSLVSQMRKICEVIAFVNIFYLISNVANNKIKMKKNIAYSIIILLSVMLAILTAGRMQILIYIVSSLFIFVFLILQKMSVKQLLKKYYKSFIVLILTILIGFCAILPLSGRKLTSNPLSYLTYYFGISIPCLDKYVSTDIDEPVVFGEETLRGLQTVAYKLKLSDYIQPTSKEWYSFQSNDGNVYYSNVFTSAKRYFHDFGWFGIVVCQIIFSVVFCTLYMSICKIKSPFLLIFVSTYYFMIIDQVRDDWFYSEFLHINMIFRFVIMLMLLIFLDNNFINVDTMKRSFLCRKKEQKIQ